MPPAPIITGVGLATALGPTAPHTWQALLAGQHIRAHTRVQPAQNYTNARVTNLAIQAAHEALSHAGWNRSNVAQDDIAVILATSKGPIENWLATASQTMAVQNFSPTFGLSAVADDLAIHVGFPSARRLTISAACASGLIALARAAIMLQAGEAARALVVAAEASVHPLLVGSFQRLGVLAPEGHLCRPFDQNRDGFLISEAAAAICLQRSDISEMSSRIRDCARIAIDGFAIGAEAQHLVAGDPTGNTLEHLLKPLMQRRGGPDLIHAHATATTADTYELAAITRALDSTHPTTPPILFSHKAALGHTLGAAGLLAIAINYQCHQSGKVPANINTTAPLPTASAVLSQSPVTRPIRRSIATAAGFGGPVAAIALSTL